MSVSNALPVALEGYRLGETLGVGSFARVVAATRGDGSQWAVKIFRRRDMSDEDFAALAVEVAVMRRLPPHPHIVRLAEYVETPEECAVVMERMLGGELFDRLATCTKFGESDARRVVRSVVSALLHCHACGVAHRDLKPENLLFETAAADSVLKVADFGLARVVAAGELMGTACGSPEYVAPEVLENRGYTQKADIWSLGVVAYVLLSGFPPFVDENHAALFELIKKGEFDFPSPHWDAVPERAKAFVRDVLIVDPERRPSAAALARHPWLELDTSIGADLPGSPKAFQAYMEHHRKVAGAHGHTSPGGRVKPHAAERVVAAFVDGVTAADVGETAWSPVSREAGALRVETT